MVGACLVRSIYGLSCWTRTASLIDDHAGLADALGGRPSHWACYRFANKLRANRPALAACLDALAASLRERLPDMGREVAIDASDIPAYANGQRFLYNHGPERQAYSDPDASWGIAQPSQRARAAGSMGTRFTLLCAVTGLPLAWEVETARRNKSLYVAPLLDAVRARGFHAETCAMDRGYDNNRVYAECHERECAPVIPLRKGRIDPNTRIPRSTDEWCSLYRRRSAVERNSGG
jgi:hypothetical protein